MKRNYHLLTEGEQSLLNEAADIAFSASFSSIVSPFAEDEGDYILNQADINSIFALLAKIERRPWYWIHYRGDKADILLRGNKHIKTIPRPEDEDTADILESVGITNKCYLEARDLTKLIAVAYYYRPRIDINAPMNDFIRSVSSSVCNSLFIGRENLENREEAFEYGETEMDTRKVIKLENMDGNAVFLPEDDFEERLFVNPPLHKLFALLAEKARTGSNVSLSIDEYMEICELNNKHEARKKVRELIKILYDMSVLIDDSSKETNYRVIDSFELEKRKGVYDIFFTPKFMNHIRGREAHLFEIPREFFAIGNPTAYWIAVYANLHRRRNLGKPNQDIINIGTLLRKTYLPLDTTGKSAKQIVIEPLRKGLNDLFERRILYAQLVRSGTGEPILETSDDYFDAWSNLTTLEELNFKISWLCNIPGYENLKNEKRTSKFPK